MSRPILTQDQWDMLGLTASTYGAYQYWAPRYDIIWRVHITNVPQMPQQVAGVQWVPSMVPTAGWGYPEWRTAGVFLTAERGELCLTKIRLLIG